MSGQQDYTSDLISLAELAGVNVPSAVLRIINELLAMQVAPEDIHQLFRAICPLQSKQDYAGGKSTASK